MSIFHAPIMVSEIMELMNPGRCGIYIDGTLGGGGHSKVILSLMGDGSRLFGIDRDEDAIAEAKSTINDDRFTAVRGNFFDINKIMNTLNISGVDGILLDLGVSSHQLDDASRGFSYNSDAGLDMRMDKSQPFSAYDVVNTYSQDDLRRIIFEYGEERFASRVANAIVRQRNIEPIENTLRLAEIIKLAIPTAAARSERQHPARRTFQAIRIEVNSELKGLDKAVSDAHDALNKDGVLSILTFHSLEDRIVKTAFKRFEDPCVCSKKAPVCTCGLKATVEILTKRPLTAGADEISNNPRAKSAKLRAIKKL
ncbi:MAG: 16S rRNA (cytosine(1402)-N(4))-methyltransferase RsmH [Clostridia bacterium]